MERLGTAKDAVTRKSYGPIATPVLEGKYPASTPHGTAKGDYFDIKQTGYTDVPDFYKQIQYLKNQAQYGKRSVDKVTKPWGIHENLSTALSGLDEARFEEGIPDIVGKQYMKTAKPFKTKEAFQRLSPNKYGGSQKGWLDKLF